MTKIVFPKNLFKICIICINNILLTITLTKKKILISIKLINKLLNKFNK